MSIVNSILNLVDLNTTKYTKKLKKMRTDTKAVAKGIGQSFASLGSAWKAAIAGIAAGALTGAITKELQATEKSVAAFITATGSLAEAARSLRCCSRPPETRSSHSTPCKP